MFGCLAVYVEDKIVLILREKRDVTEGNGVWLDTTEKLPAVDRWSLPWVGGAIMASGQCVTE